MTTPTYNAQFPPLQASRTPAASEPSAAGSPWERQPSEPALWHDRFIAYRDLGPTRTIDSAYRIIAHRDNLSAPRPGAAWYRNATDWNWSERAATWDDQQRQQLRTQENDRRFDAREERLDMITTILRQLYQHITTDWLADLTQMQLRILFLSLLAAYRTELPPPLYDPGSDGQTVEFTGSDFALAYAQLKEWRQQHTIRPQEQHEDS